MNRRGFLGYILALGAAPAIVRADSLMRIIPKEQYVWTQVVEPLVIVNPENFHEMVSKVLRKNGPQILANLQKRNALLKQYLASQSVYS